MSRMPPCYFFTKYGECSNPECMYRFVKRFPHLELVRKENSPLTRQPWFDRNHLNRHINPEENIKECPWYARGFCKHGTAPLVSCNSIIFCFFRSFVDVEPYDDDVGRNSSDMIYSKFLNRSTDGFLIG